MRQCSIRLPTYACILLFAGCGSVECCVDHAVAGVVSGIVVDDHGGPQEAVDLMAINLQQECAGSAESGPFMSGRTDAEGRFVMVAYLPLRAEGRYCFDMAMSMAGAVDTTKQLDMSMELRSPPADTTHLTLVAAW